MAAETTPRRPFETSYDGYPAPTRSAGELGALISDMHTRLTAVG